MAAAASSQGETGSPLERVGAWLREAEPFGAMLLGAFVGASCGAVAILFTLLVEGVQTLVLGSDLPPPEALGRIAWWWRLVVPAAGGIVVAPIVYRWASEARGHGVPEVIEAVAVRGGLIRRRVAMAKSLASAVTIGTGGSVGREGPIVQVGAAIGSSLGRLFGLTPEQTRNLVGCGAAAGIAATFNAPIAAAFFSLEVILGNFAVGTFGPIVLASVLATAVSRSYFGEDPAFQVPTYELVSPWELLTYLLLGLACGVVAWAFTWVLYRCEDAIEGSRIPPMLRPALGGLALGVLLLALPELYGTGFSTIGDIIAGRTTVVLVALLIGAKILGTSITLASGGSGGVFSPSLMIGAATGYVVGSVVDAVAPFATANPAAYALVGMGAVLGGATHAPITSILMLFELTSDYEVILPMMLSTTVSTITARALLAESIYSMKLVRRGLRLLGGREETVMTTFHVSDVMRPEVPLVEADTPLPEVMAKFFEAPITELYVVDVHGRLLGAISLHDVKESLAEPGLEDLVVAHDLMVPRLPLVRSDDRLADCMRAFAGSARSSLPVVDERGGRPVGIVTQRDLVDLYDREVLRREMLGTYDGAAQTPAALPAGHRLRSIRVPPSWLGRTLRDLDLRRNTGVTVIGIQPADAHLQAQTPDPERPLATGDVLVVLGSLEASATLDALLGAARASVR